MILAPVTGDAAHCVYRSTTKAYCDRSGWWIDGPLKIQMLQRLKQIEGMGLQRWINYQILVQRAHNPIDGQNLSDDDIEELPFTVEKGKILH